LLSKDDARATATCARLGKKASRPEPLKSAKVFLSRSRNRLFFDDQAEYNFAPEKAMTPIVIAVGSTRKPKVAAVREALQEIAEFLATDGKFEIEAVEVGSGVAHTPASREELMQGARQRAESLQAFARREGKAWAYFIGLEGGLDALEENGVRRVFLESWAFVSDGTRGHFGRSGAVELPRALADEVLVRGTELSVAIDEFAQETGIRDAQGAWGVLSTNKITRQDSFRIALIAAFAPFYNAKLYNLEKVRNSASAR
jgi:inosine/xanthosine triphosphatase